jgi:hypothetical protein
VFRRSLAPGLTHSSQAHSLRPQIEANWQELLDDIERELALFQSPDHQSRGLPPQVRDLHGVIEAAADEAAERILIASKDLAWRDRAISIFSNQFGVEIALDPNGPPQRLGEDCRQVATIACFVVSTRLLLYKALVASQTSRRLRGRLERLDVPSDTTDPGRVQAALVAFLDQAKRVTGDFDIQLSSTVLDEIAFVPGDGAGPVGRVWSDLVRVINGSDWTGPAEYVPGLYESLLDERHRHLMGVHYTADELAELICAYAVEDAADVVLDPAAGAGTFVTMAYQRKRHLGSTHEQALEETYGIEIADFAASLSALGLSLSDSHAISAYPRIIKTRLLRRRARLTLRAIPSRHRACPMPGGRRRGDR